MSDKKCQPFDHANMEPSWICCKCSPKTLNSNARDACKVCDHSRCDDPKTKTVFLKEEDGIRVVNIKTDVAKDKLN